MTTAEAPKKVLVIGSGPIIIGQAAEFDYAGTQACKSLREEGVEVVLVNSNPATIMTDEDVADRIYIEPLTVAVLERIIERERPDGIPRTWTAHSPSWKTVGSSAGTARRTDMTPTRSFAVWCGSR